MIPGSYRAVRWQHSRERAAVAANSIYSNAARARLASIDRGAGVLDDLAPLRDVCAQHRVNSSGEVRVGSAPWAAKLSNTPWSSEFIDVAINPRHDIAGVFAGASRRQG